MALILNIDTATEYACISLSEGSTVIAVEESFEQMNHAAFVQSAIQKLVKASAIHLQSIEAVAITNGPGSYTGLRVGLSSAKGLCYAWKKPLLLINTLEVMAAASMENMEDQPLNSHEILFCPMIDARRMEVFTALYSKAFEPIVSPCAMIIDDSVFAEKLKESTIVFSGKGSLKLHGLLKHDNAIFSNIKHKATHLAKLSAHAFAEKKFADLAYSEPFYLKEFYNPITIKK
jgi:tRNA threonylcarbamoyladenosine biosynthesis protein TsaB